MPYDGFTAAAVAYQLNNKLSGGRVERVLAPSQDELVLLIRTQDRDNVRLCLSASSNIPKVHLTSTVKDNPADPGALCMHLRKHLNSAKIVSVSQPDFERVIKIAFDTTDELGYVKREYMYAEIMGKYSNVILTDENGRIINAVKPVDMTTSSKRQVLPGMKYEAPPPQDKLIPTEVSKEDFFAAARNYGGDADSFFLKSFRGFSPLLSREAAYIARCSGKPVNEHTAALYAVFGKTVTDARNGDFNPCIIYEGKKPVEFSAFDIKQYGAGFDVVYFEDISSCIDAFYRQREENERIKQRGSDILRIITAAEARIKKKIGNQRTDLLACDDSETFRLYGDLITANIGRIPRGASSASLDDYYSEEPKKVDVPLDVRLSPSQNAQKYYKKYSKLKTAREELTKRIALSEKELDYIMTVHDALMRSETEEDLSQIRAELYETGYASDPRSDKKKKPGKPKPAHFVTTNGYDVYVGKNNTQNDFLTLKTASRGDWFFHVKGAPGSHVILVSKGVDEPPAEDFTDAAEIAAYYSSKRGGENTEVDYTEVKYVKKPAGSPPGFVIYSHNYSAVVSPDERKIGKMRAKQ